MLLSLVSHKSFFKSCSQIPTGPMARGGKNPALPSPNLLLTLISWKLITWRLLHGLLDVFFSPSDDLAVLKGSGHSPREEWDWWTSMCPSPGVQGKAGYHTPTLHSCSQSFPLPTKVQPLRG